MDKMNNTRHSNWMLFVSDRSWVRSFQFAQTKKEQMSNNKKEFSIMALESVDSAKREKKIINYAKQFYLLLNWPQLLKPVWENIGDAWGNVPFYAVRPFTHIIIIHYHCQNCYFRFNNEQIFIISVSRRSKHS